MPEPSRAEFKYLIERQKEEIRAVNEIGKLLSSTTDPEEAIRLIASYLKQIFPLALFGVLVLEPHRLHLIPFAKISQQDLTKAIRELISKSSTFFKKPISEEEFTPKIEDPSASGGSWASAPIPGLASHHIAPLQFKNRTIGLLTVWAAKEGAMATEDQHVIDIVAAQFGAALRNLFLLDELKKAGELKNDLLKVISHELRIPLTTIKEGVGLLLEGALGPTSSEQSDFLKTVGHNAQRLEELVEKVETATQLIAGQMEYRMVPTPLVALISNLLDHFRKRAEDKKIVLALEKEGDSFEAAIDAHRMRQALLALVENAIQATSEGGKVTVALSPSSQGVQIRVKDTGVGIPPQELASLFEKLYLGKGINERKTGGLGLGLFIAKTIVDAHGGTIQVESQVGKETVVTIQLPKEAP